jgi:hypothetical protein
MKKCENFINTIFKYQWTCLKIWKKSQNSIVIIINNEQFSIKGFFKLYKFPFDLLIYFKFTVSGTKPRTSKHVIFILRRSRL